MAEVETRHVPLPLPEIRPNPDPTDRTTDLLRREIQMLREVIEQRLDAYDKAIDLLQRQVDREPKPPVLSASVENLKETVSKLEDNINLRFSERDKRNEQMIRDSKALVDNTITAVKDAFNEQTRSSQAAIGKSETAISKQMDQTESKFGTEIGALNGKIDDLKGRVTILESVKVGQKEQKDEAKNIFGYVVGGAGLIISLVTVLFLIYNNASKIDTIRSELPRIDNSQPRNQ